MTVMYVLEGLNGYMLINQWRAGDKVAFHRIVSEGKLQIRTIKAASFDPPALAKKWQINRAFDNKETEGTIYQIDMLRLPRLHNRSFSVFFDIFKSQYNCCDVASTDAAYGVYNQGDP